MQKYPNGIIYKLNCEAVMPIISNTIDLFEEHTIIPNMLALNPKMVFFFSVYFMLSDFIFK
jgi:hypothetical protein